MDIPICAQKPTGTQQLLSCCPETIPKHQLSHHLHMGTSGSHSAGGTHGASGCLEAPGNPQHPGGTGKEEHFAFRRCFQGGCGTSLLGTWINRK